MDVELKGLTKRFDDVVAVDRLDLEINKGEFLVLLGPSGCGKTTALRMIAGLEVIDEGELFIGGRRVNDVLPKYRDVAMVFQSYALYPHMTVRGNISYPLKLPREIREFIEKVGFMHYDVVTIAPFTVGSIYVSFRFLV